MYKAFSYQNISRSKKQDPFPNYIFTSLTVPQFIMVIKDFYSLTLPKYQKGTEALLEQSLDGTKLQYSQKYRNHNETNT